MRDSSTTNAVRATRFTSPAVVNGYAPGPPFVWHETQHRSSMGAMSRVKSGWVACTDAAMNSEISNGAIRVANGP